MSPRKLPRRPPTFLAVYRGQPEAEAALVASQGFAAPAVIVHFPATLRPAAGIGHQPVSTVLLIFISWTGSQGICAGTICRQNGIVISTNRLFCLEANLCYRPKWLHLLYQS